MSQSSTKQHSIFATASPASSSAHSSSPSSPAGAGASSSASNASPSKVFATLPADFSLGPAHQQSSTNALTHPGTSASPISIPFKSLSKKQPHHPLISPSKLFTHFVAGQGSSSSSPSSAAKVGLGFSTAGPSNTTNRSSSVASLTLAGSSTGGAAGGWSSSSTFLRRSAATAAATAVAAASGGASSDGTLSPGQLSGLGSPNAQAKKGSSFRLRRSSMLGREITPFELDEDVQTATGQPCDQSQPGVTPMVERQIGFLPLRPSLPPCTKTDSSVSTEASVSSETAPTFMGRSNNNDDDVDMDEDGPEFMGPPRYPPTTPPPPLPEALTRFGSSESGHKNGNGSSRNGSDSPGVMQQPSPGSGGSSSNGISNRSRSGSNVARSSLAGSLVTKRAVNRRANLMPKDRGVLRVAATLQDETKPEDSEIASEAKLQKKLTGDPSLPRTPRLGGQAGGKVRSPFQGVRGFAGCAGGGIRGFASVGRSGRWGWDDDDYDALDMDGIGKDNDSSSDSEEEMAATNAQAAAMESDDETAMRDEDGGADDAAAPGSGTGAAGEGPSSLPKHRKGSLWMGFRESRAYHHRASPGTDRLLRARTPGHTLPSEMETSPKVSILGMSHHSPGPWTRSAKRKMMSGEERYEPYANSAQKRRAVSPMTLLNTASVGAGGACITSPSLLAAQHFQQQQHQQQQGGTSSGGASAMPTPISMPSPTHTFSTSASPAAPFGAYFSGSHYKPSQLGSRATTPGGSTASAAAATAALTTGRASRSRAASPAVSAISRPATPVSRAVTASGILHSYTSAILSTSAGAGVGVGVNFNAAQPLASPSLLSTSLGSAIGGGGNGTPGNAAATRNSGSGPGYGSGALGLSIGGNSASVAGSGNGGAANGGACVLSTSMTGGGGVGLFGLGSGVMAGSLGGHGGGGTASLAAVAAVGSGSWLSSGIGVSPGGYNEDELEGEEMDEGVRMLGLG